MSVTQEHAGSISLLCVDDDTWVLDALKIFFNQEPDFTVQTCSSAMEALDLLNSQHFDAVICDYSMPDMDGVALLREIRARGDNAIFIIFTGRRLANVAIETLNNGGNYYLQKGVDVQLELPRLVGYIKSHLNRPPATEIRPPSRPYTFPVENKADPACSFDTDGRYRYSNQSFKQHIAPDTGAFGYFSTVPDDERDELIRQLTSLTALNSGTHISHYTRTHDGSQKPYLWNYQAVTDESGGISGYTAQGTDLSGIICLSLPDSGAVQDSGAVKDSGAEPIQPEFSFEEDVAEPVKKTKDIQDHFADLAESVEHVQYPVFAIDRSGKIIAWNTAMAELTGEKLRDMIGKADHAYATVLYGDTRPMLIDYIFDPPAEEELKTRGITRDGDSLTGDLETVTIRKKPMLLWSKGAGICDPEGALIAAVQSIIVSTGYADTQGTGSADEEVYIGGISSIILKLSGRGLGGAIAGAIGSAVGGYGVYATNKRLFVIHNKTLDARRSDSIEFGTFIMDELFGTTVDISPRRIEELEANKVFEVWRKDISRIELKKPRLLAGFLVVETVQGESFRVYVDHTKAFVHLEQLLRMSYPDLLSRKLPVANESEMMWIDEVSSYDIMGNFGLVHPLEDIGSTAYNIPAAMHPAQKPVTRPATMSLSELKDLADSVSVVPYPVFAIDRRGKVIAWNTAIETLTGIGASAMIGKGDYAYAVPFYGSPRPMLIDYIVMPPDAPVTGDIPSVTREGDTFIGEPESLTIREKPMVMWGKATGIYNAKGVTIAAIQSILASEPPTVKTILGLFEQEKYIGGISGITVKPGGEGMSGTIAGRLGSAAGEYGVYATDQRLFVIHNPKADASRSDTVSFGTFIIDELFGTTVDTRPRRIEELEQQKVIEIWRRDITGIEMKKPMLLAGSVVLRTRNGEALRIYIDHTKAFTHLDQLLRLFYPEILIVE